jgi:hypothetical protein
LSALSTSKKINKQHQQEENCKKIQFLCNVTNTISKSVNIAKELYETLFKKDKKLANELW